MSCGHTKSQRVTKSSDTETPGLPFLQPPSTSSSTTSLGQSPSQSSPSLPDEPHHPVEGWVTLAPSSLAVREELRTKLPVSHLASVRRVPIFRALVADPALPSNHTPPTALENAGCIVADSPAKIGALMKKAMVDAGLA